MHENLSPCFSDQQLLALAAEHGTPLFVYSKAELTWRAMLLKNLQLPFGLTVRYAMKANPHAGILTLLADAGLAFDASSSYEASTLLAMGVAGDRISLSSQQPPHNLDELIAAGVRLVATSKRQLDIFGSALPKGSSLALRVNPGFGAGHYNRLTTGGANSSFGIWCSFLGDAMKQAKDKGLVIDRLQVHIGAGADPHVWGVLMEESLALVQEMPDVMTLDIGGGYKVHRYGDEHETDMKAVAAVFADQLQKFADTTGRKLHLEIEPGTWLATHMGVLVAEIVDMVDTGEDGHKFIRLNTGMNDFVRPGMYGAQHEITVLNASQTTDDYIVVGHNCETGDILTPAPSDPEGIEPRRMATANIGDIVAIHDTGSYSAAMSTKGYNGYPSAAEIIV